MRNTCRIVVVLALLVAGFSACAMPPLTVLVSLSPTPTGALPTVPATPTPDRPPAARGNGPPTYRGGPERPGGPRRGGTGIQPI